MNPKQQRTGEQPPAPRKMPVADALALAVQWHQNGRLSEAESLYRQILQAVPGQPDALHFLGLLSGQQGNAEAGIALIRQAIAGQPDYASAHNNLGNLLKQQGRLEEAAAAYQEALALRPDFADAYNNLGVVLKQQGHLAEAHAAYQRAIELRPDFADAYLNLGNLLRKQGRLTEAVTAFRQALALAPAKPAALSSLGAALYRLGETGQAEAAFRDCLRRDPDNPIARHMLAACTRENVPDRAANGFVQAIFDGMADSFDDHLRELDYRAPALTTELVAELFPAPDGRLDVLDAGCGTGLCGLRLRPYARCLTGVDLSAGMLSKARAWGVYDELIQGELTGFMAGRTDAYDLIVSADTLNYFGALPPVFTAAAAALRPGGRLIFTVESAAEEIPAGFRLNPHGRYSHTDGYLESALSAAGLALQSITPVVLRLEEGEPVSGRLVLAARIAASP